MTFRTYLVDINRGTALLRANEISVNPETGEDFQIGDSVSADCFTNLEPGDPKRPWPMLHGSYTIKEVQVDVCNFREITCQTLYV